MGHDVRANFAAAICPPLLRDWEMTALRARGENVRRTFRGVKHGDGSRCHASRLASFTLVGDDMDDLDDHVRVITKR